MSSSKSNQPINPEKLQEAQNKAFEYQKPINKSKKALLKTESQRRSYVNEQIEQAMAAGEFDNLPGYGKPLNLNKNPYENSAEALAYGLLKDNGFAPEWIERDKEIRKMLTEARNDLQSAWHRYKNGYCDVSVWQVATNHFAEVVQKLNVKINNFNLVVPILSKQRLLLSVEDEIEQVKEAKIKSNLIS